MEGFPSKMIGIKNIKECYMVRFSKKTTMMISFAVGSLMFVTTAIAEVASKSGYDQAKAALKNTAEQLTSKLSSYTIDLSYAVKDNGKVIFSRSSVNKYDISKLSCENISTMVEGDKKKQDYFYRDIDTIVNYDNEVDTYRILKNQDKGNWLKNPFKEQRAGDIEKISDAFVGNLKDYVVVSEKNDGSKELSGSISEAQIPALVNAVISYEVKGQFTTNRFPGDQRSGYPSITQDIFVKEAKGNMVVDKNGLLQSVLITGKLFGKEDKGIEHNLTLEVLIKVSNVNSTIVSKPDLSGKKVEKFDEENNKKPVNLSIMLGKYKNDIVLLKDNKVEKIGERFLDITHVDDKNISGRYYEEYKKGYEQYAASKKDFKFEASLLEKDNRGGEFDYTNDTGKIEKGYIYMQYESAKINFDSNCFKNKDIWYDGTFSRVFD